MEPVSDAERGDRLARAVEFLIANGHAWADVRGYTTAQVSLFVRLARERLDEDSVSVAALTAHGVNAGMTGNWKGIKALSKKVTGKASAGESATMAEFRNRVKQFLGPLGGPK